MAYVLRLPKEKYVYLYILCVYQCNVMFLMTLDVICFKQVQYAKMETLIILNL